MAQWANQRGFTIVELLIVIVVIAILAGISTVAYNGIQQRSKNTQRIAAAKEWQKRIIAYTSSTGSYPASTIGNHFCLGGDGYPTNLDTNADIDCYASNNVKHVLASVNTAYAALGALPTYPGDKIDSGTGYGVVAGISLRAMDTFDPAGSAKAQYPMLWYWLEGSGQDCILRPVVSAVSGGFQVTSSVNSASTTGVSTLCIIALQDPSYL